MVSVNPTSPSANTGCVDFFPQSSEALAWDVPRFDTGANRFTNLFSQIGPNGDQILR